MGGPAVPRSWPWVARLRSAADLSWGVWAVSSLAQLGRPSVAGVLLGALVGLLLVLGWVAVSGPSRTQLEVAWALRSGRVAGDQSLALVDTEAARRLRAGRWTRVAVVAGLVLVVAGWALVLGRGADPPRVALSAVLSVVAVAWSGAALTTVREARRWVATSDDRWTARAGRS